MDWEGEDRVLLESSVAVFAQYLTKLSVSVPYSVRDRIVSGCGTVGRMRIGTGNSSTRKFSVSVTICQSKTSHDVTFDRTRVATVVLAYSRSEQLVLKRDKPPT
jgi:hypothetical protein